MKVFLTRVHKAAVSVEGKLISEIDMGLAVFIGVERGDGDSQVIEMAQKLVDLRIFENREGKLDYSVKDKNYPILCISNFTLCANTKKGRRPSFESSMPLDEANKIFQNLVLILRSKEIVVKTGIFGAHMDIDLSLDGPVNIILTSKAQTKE